MSLPCMNCKTAVPQDKAKFFAEVFLCESCHLQAEHFYKRLLAELNFLLTIAKETIRLSLVQGKFAFPEGPAGEPSKRAVLEEIMRLEEARASHNKERACAPTQSSEPSLPTAPSKGLPAAEAPASSNKDSTPG